MPAVPAISALRRGEAGRAGSDVRSDLHVSFEEHTSGGIQIDLRSRVNLYYGERIRQQISEVVRSSASNTRNLPSSTKARCRS
jgi:citrate lyase gamma subunit